MPAGTLGTEQPPVLLVPAIVPSGLAVSSHTSPVLNVVLPICTKIVSPAGHPLPDTVKPWPGAADVGETEILGL